MFTSAFVRCFLRSSFLSSRCKQGRQMGSRRKRKATEDDLTTKQMKKDGLVWSEFGEETGYGLKPLILLENEMKGCEKIAGFDLDDTLIKTASGRKFPTGCNDWKLWSDTVPEKLQSLIKDGYKIIIFTNQAGLEKKKTTVKELTTKIFNIKDKLGINLQVFISTGESHFRKPSTKMWEFMLEKHNQGVVMDKKESFYVGDAAGRAKGWMSGKPKDFSCSDRKFAVNIGINFFTPEEFFEGQPKAAFEWRSKEPISFIQEPAGTDYSKLAINTTEMVIMVGPPAAGKSTISRKFLAEKNYAIVNRDTLKTQEKCLKQAMLELKAGKSVIVDNTNPSKETRAAYIKMAKSLKVPVRCFWFQTSIDLAHHLNMFRQTQSCGKQRRVPDVGFNMFKSKFEEPSLSEGFSAINKIEFKADFDNEADKELFSQWS